MPDLTLFYDTETSGIPNNRLNVDDPDQPHLIQLGAVLVEDNGAEWAAFELIIKPPEGFVIPERASAVHGITTAIANAVGVPLLVAAAAFTNLRALASTVVAYNVPFDEAIMATALARTGRKSTLTDNARRVCCMELASPIVNLPPTPKMLKAGYNKPKNPNLTEAHQFFFGKAFDGAHGALADVRATMAVWFEIQRRTTENQHD